ncbi:MAG: hypothetical protein AB1467_07000 [Candidatus Diapherotrites archaeon]
MPLYSRNPQEAEIISEKACIDRAKQKLKKKGIKKPKIATLACALFILGVKPNKARLIFSELALKNTTDAGAALRIAEENFDAFMKLKKQGFGIKTKPRRQVQKLRPKRKLILRRRP